MPVEMTYSGYRDFGGVMFPSRIVQTKGGHPVLDITVTSAKVNSTAAIPVPDPVRSFTPPAVQVTVQKVAEGVHYLTGGSHHSVAIEQPDHIVLVEAPQSEERALALIAKVKETIPNKPIRYTVNTHVHFDHSSGLRTLVDEGSTIVTHQVNRPYYEKAWANPRSVGPDRLDMSRKPATFLTLTDKLILPDSATRPVEVHLIAGSGHADGFVMVYLPREKILIEADAYTPPAAGTAPPATPNPFAVNLSDNIERLKLDVAQILALHGPRVTTMADLASFIGRSATPPGRGTN
jgi:glyoxylase-like metal-dependent hydrolase (beta-lactamase superfamily II)